MKSFAKIVNYLVCFFFIVFTVSTPFIILFNKNPLLLNLGFLALGSMSLTMLLIYWFIGNRFDTLFLEDLKHYSIEDFGLFNISVFSDKMLIQMKASRSAFYAGCIAMNALNMLPRSLVQEKLFNDKRFRDNITPWRVFISFLLPISLALGGILGVLSMFLN